LPLPIHDPVVNETVKYKMSKCHNTLGNKLQRGLANQKPFPELFYINREWNFDRIIMLRQKYTYS